MGKFQKLCLSLIFPLFIISFSYLFYEKVEIFDIIELESSTGAKCLDGSNYQFYLKRNPSSPNFIIFFDGGGWCSNKVYPSVLSSCEKRAQTYLGSTDYIINRISSFFGKYAHYKPWMYFLSDDSNHNPDFHNYNKIIMKYCDGRGYVGYNNDPITFNNTSKLYFRGLNNTMETLKYAINQLNLLKSENLIISGMSAGGLASLYYTNYIRKLLPGTIKMRTISDSGLFMDFENVNKNGYNISSIWKGLIEETHPEYGDFLDSYCQFKEKDIWKCFVAEYFIEKIEGPVFIMQSGFDAYAIINFIGDKCKIDWKWYDKEFCFKSEIKLYREKLIKLYEKISKDKENWGWYIPSCFLHDFLNFSFDFDNEKVIIEGLTVQKALNRWISYDNSTIRLIDTHSEINKNVKNYLKGIYI